MPHEYVGDVWSEASNCKKLILCHQSCRRPVTLQAQLAAEWTECSATVRYIIIRCYNKWWYPPLWLITELYGVKIHSFIFNITDIYCYVSALHAWLLVTSLTSLLCHSILINTIFVIFIILNTKPLLQTVRIHAKQCCCDTWILTPIKSTNIFRYHGGSGVAKS